MDFLVVVDDVLARRFFPVWTVEWCFLVLFCAASILFEFSELEFKLWVDSVWFPNSKSSWNARKPSCGWEASFNALERMQARYWSAESFWPFCVPEQTCLKKTLIKFLTNEKDRNKSHLRMPNVKNSWIGCSNDFYIRPNVLAIKHHIFSAPTRDNWKYEHVQVKQEEKIN